MPVLVYIRRSKEFDKAVLNFARHELNAEDILTISEYFNGDYRIDMNDSTLDDSPKAEAFIKTNLSLDKIIFRDRVLRNTPLKDCLILIRRATAGLLDIFEKNAFESLVIYPVDNYIMDIMVQVARSYGVKVYGVSNFFISNYKRITTYGEHNQIREPSPNEVGEVVETLKGRFRSHMAPKRSKALKAAIFRYFKYKARFLLFYLVGAKLLGRKEYDLLATPYNTSVREFLNFFVERHFKKLSEVEFLQNSIFIPLHYFPEATIEYWSNDTKMVEFEDMIRCKVAELSSRYDQIILKEHPATVYDNNNHFYTSLLKNPKVVFIDPFIATSEILTSANIIGCWTGTIGIEALVNGKQVEFFSEGQYYLNSKETHPEIYEVDGELVSIKEPHIFVREILKGSIKIANS
ncbi:hypothetical protein GCM10009092_17570 [Bowmanella denitrificans]|uniref:Capsule polysaccharide biosynthesis protein n=1 Tax=Bowmanella denitrificans TaxID=366582 RepID=A0ABN0X2Z4_9ALTE